MQPTEQDTFSSKGYYLACDEARYPTYRQLGILWAKALHRRVLVFHLLRWAARSIGFGGEVVNRINGRSAVLNYDKVREAIVPSWAASSDKASRQLGFRPVTPFPERMEPTAQWFIDNNWL